MWPRKKFFFIKTMNVCKRVHSQWQNFINWCIKHESITVLRRPNNSLNNGFFRVNLHQRRPRWVWRLIRRCQQFLECTRDNPHRLPSKGKTINGEFYPNFLDRFNEDLKKNTTHMAKKKVLFIKTSTHVCSLNGKILWVGLRIGTSSAVFSGFSP